MSRPCAGYPPATPAGRTTSGPAAREAERRADRPAPRIRAREPQRRRRRPAGRSRSATSSFGVEQHDGRVRDARRELDPDGRGAGDDVGVRDEVAGGDDDARAGDLGVAGAGRDPGRARDRAAGDRGGLRVAGRVDRARAGAGSRPTNTSGSPDASMTPAISPDDLGRRGQEAVRRAGPRSSCAAARPSVGSPLTASSPPASQMMSTACAAPTSPPAPGRAPRSRPSPGRPRPRGRARTPAPRPR